MKKKSFLKVIIFLFATFCSCRAYAATETEVRAFLNTTGEKLIETLGMEDLEQRYAILDDMFENNVDTVYMGKYTLGQYYSSLTDEQKQRYHALFNRYIKSLYKSYPIDFKTEEIGFEILKVMFKDKSIDAVASVDLPEKYRTENIQAIKVEFKLHEQDGRLFLADLKIGEVSMLIVLKNRFMNKIKENEYEMEWFLDDFEDLTNSNEKHLALEY